MARTLRQAQKQEKRQVEESKSETEPFPGEKAAEYLEETLSWTLLVLVNNKTETKIKTPGGPKLRPNLPHLTKKYPSCSHRGWQASFQPAVPWVDHVLDVAGAEGPRHAHAHPHHHPGHQDHG